MIDRAFRKRSRLLRFALLTALLSLVVRLAYIQIAEATELSGEAKENIKADKLIVGTRGTIYDRNNNKLAVTGVAYDLNINLDVFRAKDAKERGDTPEEYARFLAPLIGESEQKLIEYMDFSNPERRGAEVGPKGRKVDVAVHDKIEEMHKQEKFLGITTMRTDIRRYPNGSFAAHVLGYTGTEEKLNGNRYERYEVGRAGVEAVYDDLLTGKPGRAEFYIDRLGYPIPTHPMTVKVPPVDGQDVVLTIDSTIQHFVEEELNNIVQKYKPKHASIIVVDPNNGEILALGNRPTYNPNEYYKPEYEEALWNNWALRSFEPGSTFKSFVLTAALAEHKLDLSEKFQSGKINVDGTVFSDWNNGQGFGTISYREGVYESSNVGFIKIGQKLGESTLYDYIYRFGFDKKTGVDLPGEESSNLFKPGKMRSSEFASTAFGQGISVTPIQQVAAMMAIANGGKIYQPHVLKELRDQKTGETKMERKPTVLGEVADEETLATVRQVLEETITVDKNKTSYLKGYHVAGKTGTAQVPRLDGQGGYEDNRYRLSFIGFAPANKPRVLIYVTVDQPAPGTAPLQYGSLVAAPSARVVLENTLRYLQVPIDPNDGGKDANNPGEGQKDKTAAQETITFLNVPDLIGETREQIEAKKEQGGFKFQFVGDGPRVTGQFPDVSYGQVPAGTEIKLYFGPEGSKDGKVKMPDLRGQSLREAIETLALLELEVETTGTGYVVKQGIAPGTMVPFGTSVKLELTPQS
jgi:cell division protein FtsI/penicillin-binding protein 2